MKTQVLQRVIFYLIFLVIIALALIFSLHNTSHNPKRYYNAMDSFMTNVHANNYRQGKLQNVLTSPHVTHFTKNDTTFADKPYLVAQGKTGPAWHISALHGKTTQGDKIVYLWDNVKIVQPPGKQSHNITLLTSHLTYYPDTQIANTEAPVTIIEPDTTIHGVGMNADIQKGIIKLLHQTRGKYETPQQPTS